MLTITIETKDEQRHEYDFTDSGLEFQETLKEIERQFNPQEVNRVVVIYDDGATSSDGTGEVSGFALPQYYTHEQFLQKAKKWIF